ncbi:MAG: M55 family metallopeptidase, partial [Bacteroidota bacterium]
MRVFIAVDMEGATGVVHHDQLMPDGRGYAAAQKLLTADVNAVIEGVLLVEPQAEVVVGDGHGIMRNVLLDQLHPSA